MNTVFCLGYLPFAWLEELKRLPLLLSAVPNEGLLCGREATCTPQAEEVNKFPVKFTALVVVAKYVKRIHIKYQLVPLRLTCC